jgi:hypothetical protein
MDQRRTLIVTARPRIGSIFTLLPAFLLLVSSLQAQVCSTMNTVGRYVVACSGYLSPAPNAPLVPAKILGTATADYSGTFNGSATASIGGGILTQTVKGTEQLNGDCTGTITYAQILNGKPGPPLDITFVVSEHVDRIDGLVTDPGAVLSCVLKRISTSFDPSISESAAGKKEGNRLASRLTAPSPSRTPQHEGLKPR